MKAIIKYQVGLLFLSILFSPFSMAIVPGFTLPSTANPAFVGQRATPEVLQKPKSVPSPLFIIEQPPETKQSAPATVNSSKATNKKASSPKSSANKSS